MNFLYSKKISPDTKTQFQQTLENINLFGISANTKGLITFANHFVFEKTGWTAKEVVGKDYFDIFVPEDERKLRREEFEKALKKEGIWEERMRRVLTKTGEILYVKFNATLISDEKGKIIGITKIGEDVSEQQKMTSALQDTNAALQDLFDNSNDLIFIISTKGKFLFANKAFKKKLGYSNTELELINVEILIAEEAKLATYRRVLETTRGDVLPKFATTLVSKKGKLVHLEGNITCRFSENKPVAIRGILHDITDKIRAEKAQTLYYSIGNLIVKSKNLEQLYRSIHQELGKIIDVKNFYIKLYNSTKDEILFSYYTDEARPDAKLTRRKAGLGLTDFVMESQKAKVFYEEDIRQLSQANKIKIFGPMPKIWLGVPLKYDNEIIGLVSVKCYRSRHTYNASDLELLDFISGQIALAIQRKKTEERLRNQNARIQAIFESGSHIMWSMNRKNQLTSFNQNYRQAIVEQYNTIPKISVDLDVLREKMTKNNNYQIWQERYEKAFKGSFQHFEVKVELPDKQVKWREVYLNPIRLDDNRIEEVSAIAHDITAKKKANQEVINAKNMAEKSLKVKEDFLANMSHEIRTPMNGVIGMVDLMLDSKLNDEQYNYMNTVKKSSETLMNILNDILDLSKLEAEKMEIHQRPVDFAITIEKVYALFLQQANSKNIQLKYRLDEKIPDCILADETRLIQIISNLVSNAVKFTEKGEVSIEVSIEEQKQNKTWIGVAVKDTGIGIEQKDLEKLFESFTQIDDTSSKSYSGTGLGLSISKALAKLMHGHIGVESKKGEGSSFYFVFKTEATNAIPTNLQDLREQVIFNNQFQDYKPYVLVIDDNIINRTVASEILLKAGCEVDTAESGLEAITKVSTLSQNKMYDVILMDIQMPELDGVETTQKLKALPIKNLPPVVAMTAYSMKEDREKFLKKGLDDYLSKPIKAEKLIQKIRTLIHLEQKKESPKARKQILEKLENKSNILDLKVLEQLKKYGGNELVNTSLREFEEDTENLLKSSKKALKKADYELLRSNLHTLKGNAGTLGVLKVAEKATDLEFTLKTEVPKNLKEDFKTLIAYFEEFKTSYQPILDKNS